jgi:hypothetical protein
MKIAGIVVVVISMVAGVAYTSLCPCGPIPGAWLFGEGHDEPVTDWSFVNERELVPLCQVQITTWRPHSINLNCMSDDGELFISCSNCAGKNWSNNAISHPSGQLRAGGKVYPVTLQRVTDAERLDAIWQARLRKINAEQTDRPAHWWTFHLTSR